MDQHVVMSPSHPGWRRSAAIAGVLALVVLALAGPAAALPARPSRSGLQAATRSALSRAECAANRSVGTITYVSPFGYDASAGIIDVFAAERLGYFAALCLRVDIVANSFDANELVSSGKAQVTNEGSAADTLQAIAGGAHLVGVETAGDTSDYALVTQPDITDLRQLENKTLGYYAPFPVAIREMLVRAGVDLSKVNLVADTDYDPMQLIRGTVQALQAYQSNQVLELRASHQRFREWTPAQFHVAGTFNVMVVNAAFLARHRLVVGDFMRADLHALDYCLAHQGSCVAIEGDAARAAGSPFTVAHERAVWALESGFVRHDGLEGAGYGVETRAEWGPEARALRQLGVVRAVPSLRRSEDTSLVASLYRGTALVWP